MHDLSLIRDYNANNATTQSFLRERVLGNHREQALFALFRHPLPAHWELRTTRHRRTRSAPGATTQRTTP